MTKLCPKCEKEKDVSEFYKSKKGAPLSWCKKCNCIKNLAWAKRNSVKLASYIRKRKYGISEKQYEDLLSAQKEVCAICKEAFQKTPQVDHDHSTRKIRGLLCYLCNTGLGSFRDSIEKLTAAISYLTLNQSDESTSKG